MDRMLMRNLVQWKNKPHRKPLIINGARQVGKTWLLKEFGRQHFKNVAYVNLDENAVMKSQFESGYDIPRIVSAIQFETGQIVEEGKTLIILDEIQECPKAITSLKYFCEDAPNFAVAAAGSLLGLTVHSGTGYPVGKVDTFDLYPLSFREFLDATGNKELLQLLNTNDPMLINSFSSRFVPLLRQYYYVGGMPEVVSAFLDSGLLEDARLIQEQILLGYERDISKHLSRAETEHTLAVWNSIPAHLGKENKRFVFGHVAEGGRARDYRSGITWLSQAGLAVKVPRISKPGIPLRAYAEGNIFKLFLLDVGLLGAMAHLPKETVIGGNSIFEEFKGALTEQYVCQQLISECGLEPCYWSAANSTGEIDFLVQDLGAIIAVEVKAEENLRARSLRAFKSAHKEVHAVRFSLSGYREQEWMKNVPLYAVSDKGLWLE